MNFRTFLYTIYILSAVTFLYSCGSSVDDGDGLTGDDSTTIIQHEKNAKIEKIFASIPSQSETTEMLQKAGARYSAKLLNPIENISKYSSTKNKALNLGIYGIDLGVTNIFEQTQESVLYLRCTNKMATSLGISGAFDENTSSRLDANSDNKDSLLAIITESYKTADNYLQENGQPGVSCLMVVGAWIEGMYIASQIATDTKSEEIINRIAKEKGTLEDLISLLEGYKSENEGTEDVIASLKDIKQIYDSAAAETLSAEQFKQIADKINEIRNKII